MLKANLCASRGTAVDIYIRIVRNTSAKPSLPTLSPYRMFKFVSASVLIKDFVLTADAADLNALQEHTNYKLESSSTAASRVRLRVATSA